MDKKRDQMVYRVHKLREAYIKAVKALDKATAARTKAAEALHSARLDLACHYPDEVL